jgi:hypothetical protein
MNQTASHSTLVKKIVKALRALPETDVLPLHGGPYMPAGTPDLLVVSQGFAIFLEVKTGKAKTSIAQDRQIERWERIGAAVFIIRDVDAAVELVKFAVNQEVFLWRVNPKKWRQPFEEDHAE